jgi:two-component system, OmpR family, response regulator ChvI
VVDNDPNVTESFGLVLEDSGLYQVAKYNDPLLALSELKPNVFDLVLLDIKIPNVDSFELFERMKTIDSNLKVCFIGTYDNEESHRALKDRFPTLESECFMSKEVPIKDMIRRVSAQLKVKED